MEQPNSNDWNDVFLLIARQSGRIRIWWLDMNAIGSNITNIILFFLKLQFFSILTNNSLINNQKPKLYQQCIYVVSETYYRYFC